MIRWGEEMATGDMKPGFRKLVRTLREQRDNKYYKLSHEQILAWAERNDVQGSIGELRSMIEDARSLTPNSASDKEVKP